MFYFLLFCLGSIITSGLTCYWQRGWSDFSNIKQRSKCHHNNCQHILNYWQLIPLVGWIAQRGCCRYCRQAIDLIYPIGELFGGLWMVIVALSYADIVIGSNFDRLILITTGLLMARLIYTDMTSYRLPPLYVLMVAVSGCYLHGEWLTALCLSISFILVKIGYELYSQQRALGFGDVQLACALGFWLPLDFIPQFYVITGLLGIIFGYRWRHQYKISIFPLGPCLMLSFACLYLGKIASSH